MRPKYLQKILNQSNRVLWVTHGTHGKNNATNNQRSLWSDMQHAQCVRQQLCNHRKQNKTLAGGRRSRQHFSRYSGSKWHHWLRMEVESLRPSLFLSLSSDLRISDVFPDSDAGLGSGCYWSFSQTANIAEEPEMRRGQGHGWGGSGQDFHPWKSCPRGTSGSLRTHSTWTVCLCVCLCPA